jgi:hypothetical protein
MTDETGSDWIPDSCTLPTAERPLRVAEFDDLFGTSLRGVERLDDTTLQLTLDAGAETRARELAGRETACCSFFRFDFSPAGESVAMRVSVPATQVAVLDALAGRAAGPF